MQVSKIKSAEQNSSFSNGLCRNGLSNFVKTTYSFPSLIFSRTISRSSIERNFALTSTEFFCSVAETCCTFLLKGLLVYMAFPSFSAMPDTGLLGLDCAMNISKADDCLLDLVLEGIEDLLFPNEKFI